MLPQITRAITSAASMTTPGDNCCHCSKDNWSAKLKLFYPREGEGFGDEVELSSAPRQTTADVALLKNVEFEALPSSAKRLSTAAAQPTRHLLTQVVAEYYSDNLKDDDGLGWIRRRGLLSSRLRC